MTVRVFEGHLVRLALRAGFDPLPPPIPQLPVARIESQDGLLQNRPKPPAPTLGGAHNPAVRVFFARSRPHPLERDAGARPRTHAHPLAHALARARY